MQKSQLLARILSTRADLEACLGQIPEHLWEKANVCGEWTAKDVLAHITWHEREMIGVIQTRSLIGSALWDLPLDERNAAIQAEGKDRTAAEVRAEAPQVFQQLLQQIETLEQNELEDANRFVNMPADWLPWQLFSENTWEHYIDHTREINAWLHSPDAWK